MPSNHPYRAPNAPAQYPSPLPHPNSQPLPHAHPYHQPRHLPWHFRLHFASLPPTSFNLYLALDPRRDPIQRDPNEEELIAEVSRMLSHRRAKMRWVLFVMRGPLAGVYDSGFTSLVSMLQDMVSSWRGLPDEERVMDIFAGTQDEVDMATIRMIQDGQHTPEDEQPRQSARHSIDSTYSSAYAPTAVSVDWSDTSNTSTHNTTPTLHPPPISAAPDNRPSKDVIDAVAIYTEDYRHQIAALQERVGQQESYIRDLLHRTSSDVVYLVRIEAPTCIPPYTRRKAKSIPSGEAIRAWAAAEWKEDGMNDPKMFKLRMADGWKCEEWAAKEGKRRQREDEDIVEIAVVIKPSRSFQATFADTPVEGFQAASPPGSRRPRQVEHAQPPTDTPLLGLQPLASPALIADTANTDPWPHPPPQPVIKNRKHYLDTLLSRPENTTISREILTIIKEEGVSLDTFLGVKLLDLTRIINSEAETIALRLKAEEGKTAEMKAQLEACEKALEKLADKAGYTVPYPTLPSGVITPARAAVDGDEPPVRGGEEDTQKVQEGLLSWLGKVQEEEYEGREVVMGDASVVGFEVAEPLVQGGVKREEGEKGEEGRVGDAELELDEQRLNAAVHTPLPDTSSDDGAAYNPFVYHPPTVATTLPPVPSTPRASGRLLRQHHTVPLSGPRSFFTDGNPFYVPSPTLATPAKRFFSSPRSPKSATSTPSRRKTSTPNRVTSANSDAIATHKTPTKSPKALGSRSPITREGKEGKSRAKSLSPEKALKNVLGGGQGALKAVLGLGFGWIGAVEEREKKGRAGEEESGHDSGTGAPPVPKPSPAAGDITMMSDTSSDEDGGKSAMDVSMAVFEEGAGVGNRMDRSAGRLDVTMDEA
ncbi:hypothetical protein IAT38_005121 [Cryptococcus sp. DSM 104549]